MVIEKGNSYEPNIEEEESKLHAQADVKMMDINNNNNNNNKSNQNNDTNEEGSSSKRKEPEGQTGEEEATTKRRKVDGERNVEMVMNDICRAKAAGITLPKLKV